MPKIDNIFFTSYDGYVIQAKTGEELAKFFADAFREVVLPSLENFATKDNLKNLATKEDLKNLATKVDLLDVSAKNGLQDIKEELKEVNMRLDKLTNTKDDHELRIKNLEVKVFQT